MRKELGVGACYWGEKKGNAQSGTRDESIQHYNALVAGKDTIFRKIGAGEGELEASGELESPLLRGGRTGEQPPPSLT